MLELVSKRGEPLSETLRPYRERYFLTGEINIEVADVALTLQELKEHFAAQGEISHLDGISVTAEDWHLNVRPSNTEPLLRLNLEALDPALMERKRDEALAVIAGAGRLTRPTVTRAGPKPRPRWRSLSRAASAAEQVVHRAAHDLGPRGGAGDALEAEAEVERVGRRDDRGSLREAGRLVRNTKSFEFGALPGGGPVDRPAVQCRRVSNEVDPSPSGR